MEEYKQAEVTFKYYTPEHNDEVFLHINALHMYCLLNDIDQACRNVMKYEENASEDRLELAERIRQMIYENMDMNRVC